MCRRSIRCAVLALTHPDLRAIPLSSRALPLFALILLSTLALTISAQTPTPVPVLTWRYDLTHAGQNTNETALTPANVNVNSFGKLFALPVDSTVYAQPLYVPALKMSDGQVHNVLFVATENDSIYAFDADSNGGANANPIWQVSLLTSSHGAAAGATAIPYEDTGSPDVAPTVGITGTPVIDPTTNTMYVVANTKENGQYYSRLHAINITNGAEQSGSPVNITATVAGTGHGSSGGQLTFSPLYQNQRTALDLYNGHVYFGYAAHGDLGDWHGWLFSYDAKTLQQTDVLCLSPNGYGAGLWASGAGLPIDNDATGGRMFLVTGNGTHSTFPPFDSNTEYGESVIALNLSNGKLTPTDAFTSYNFQTLNDHDWDQGSGGLLMVPDNTGPNPHMLITAGKEGRILVLDRDNLGGYLAGASSNTNALQDIPGVIPQGVGFWSTPAYWNGHVYMWAEKNVPMMFDIIDGVMDAEPDSKGTINSDFPDPTFSVSSNGTQDGIAWAVRSDQFNTEGPAVLYAWTANDLSNPIYESDTNASRDSAGPANKFSIPVVTNGKVYVAAHGEVDVYGLFNGQPAAAAPVISPNGGTFASSQNVAITSTTGSASIYYTLDGSTPTTASTLYSGPVTIDTDTTVKAIASAPGYLQSALTTATFAFSDQVPPVTVTPPGGTYLSAQKVTLADADANAKIYYTTDQSTPSAASTPYTGPIQVGVSETIEAIAIDPALRDSNVASAAYVIQNGGTSINFANGFSSTAGLTLNGSAVASNDTRLQLTNGGLNQAGSVFWNAPISVQAFTTNFEFQLSYAEGNGFTFTIQNAGPTALGGSSAGLGYQDIPKSIAVKFNFYNFQNEGDDSTGLYTDGEAPVQPSVDLSGSGVILNSGDAIQAQITYDGTNLTLNLYDVVNKAKFSQSWPINIPAVVGGNTAYVGFTGGTGGLSASQKLLNWTYTTQAVPPAFSPAPGTYNSPQNVSLSSATSNAMIYYTTDGSQPSAASTQYSAPIPVSATQVISAIAISETYGSSNVASGSYTINNSQTAASFSLTGTTPPATSAGNSATSNLTITPANSFTGAVALTCAVTGPSGAVDTPTCSVTQPAVISGTQPVSATLTVTTQADTTPGTYTATVTGTWGSVTQTANIAIAVTAAATGPSFALDGTPVNIATPGTTGTSTITLTPADGFTGTISLRCAVTGGPADAVDAPTCSIGQPAGITGTQAVSATLTVATQATTTPGSYTATVTGTSGGLTETALVTIAVSGATTASSFSLAAPPITITSPATSGTSTITVTPANGFTGAVKLTCALTNGPAQAANPPACSVTQPAAISGTQPVTATLTVTLDGSSTALLRNAKPRIFGWGGGSTLAALLFFCLPYRRRKWHTTICMVLLAIVAAAGIGCGSASVVKPSNVKTTSGSYTVTVTGTSGSQQATGTVAVTVN